MLIRNNCGWMVWMLARSAYQTDADELAAARFPGKPLMAGAVHGSAYRIVCFLSSRPPKTRGKEYFIYYSVAKTNPKRHKVWRDKQKLFFKGLFFLEAGGGDMPEFSENNEAFQRNRQQL